MKTNTNKSLSIYSIGGVAITALANETSVEFTAECWWVLIAALTYSLYLVFMKKNVDTEEKLDIPMFLGR